MIRLVEGMASNQPNSPRSVSTEKSYYTANGSHSYHTAEGPMDSTNQNLSGFENQVHTSASASSAAAAANAKEPVMMTIELVHALYELTAHTIRSAGIPQFTTDLLTCNGGAVYTLLSETMPIEPLETFDCDMVLWPNVNPNVAFDLSVQVKRISEHIIENIKAVYDSMEPSIQSVIEKAVDSKTPIFTISIYTHPKYGKIIINNNITVIIVGKKTVKIELVIHNARNSQEFLIDHQQVTDRHTAMIYDPMYCPVPNIYQIPNRATRVPSLVTFVVQQFFSFTNLFFTKNPVPLKNINRINLIFQGLDEQYKPNLAQDMARMIKGVISNTYDQAIRTRYMQTIEQATTGSGLYPMILLHYFQGAHSSKAAMKQALLKGVVNMRPSVKNMIQEPYRSLLDDMLRTNKNDPQLQTKFDELYNKLKNNNQQNALSLLIMETYRSDGGRKTKSNKRTIKRKKNKSKTKKRSTR